MSDDEWISGRLLLGSLMLPHGTACDVYWSEGGLELDWDLLPQCWPRADREHWGRVVVPALLAALATLRPAPRELDT